MCLSISTIFSTEDVSRREEVTRFSTPRITPSAVETYECIRGYVPSHDIWRRTYAYCGAAELDGFERIFDLEETTFGRKGTICCQIWSLEKRVFIILDTTV
jgi:hypothetical protein